MHSCYLDQRLMAKIMKINCGIIGLPNVGKSTLFNVLTNMSVKTANFPFCTIQPNVAIVHIPDPRIYQLANIAHSYQTIYGTMEFIDIAGLITGAATGEGLGDKTLTYIRELKALCHVVRCFDDDQIIHVSGNVNPERDIKTINTELILFDILQCEKKINFLQKNNKISTDKNEQELFILHKCLMYLNNGVLLNTIQFSYEEQINIKKFNFLTFKPILYIANIGITCTNNVYVHKLRSVLSQNNKLLVSCCVKSLLLHNYNENNDSNNTHIQNINNQRKCILKKIIDNIFYTLNLCTFFTINMRITQAWISNTDTIALKAANRIHSDFKKGFIRVQVMKYCDFINYHGEYGVKKAGKIYSEGKHYCIQDGDIIKFLFNK